MFTVGHSNHDLDAFLDLLKAHDIQLLVDVRSQPYSRYASQFNRDSICAAVRGFGVKYSFAGESIGGRPSDPTCYDSAAASGPFELNSLGAVNYAEIAKKQWFQEGLQRLIDVAREHQTAIMCSEEDPSRCHRHNLLAAQLLEKGLDVLHIRKSGGLESAAAMNEDTQDESSAKLDLL